MGNCFPGIRNALGSNLSPRALEHNGVESSSAQLSDAGCFVIQCLCPFTFFIIIIIIIIYLLLLFYFSRLLRDGKLYRRSDAFPLVVKQEPEDSTTLELPAVELMDGDRETDGRGVGNKSGKSAGNQETDGKQAQNAGESAHDLLTDDESEVGSDGDKESISDSGKAIVSPFTTDCDQLFLEGDPPSRPAGNS